MRNWNLIDPLYEELCRDVYPQPNEDGRISITHDIITSAPIGDVQSVFDAGCGYGYAKMFFPNSKYFGSTLVKEEVGENVALSDYNFHEGEYDLVFSSHSLEHSPFPLLTLMRWHAIGKNLLLIVPNPEYYGYVGQNHYAVSSIQQLRWLLRRAGWKVVWKKHSDTDLAYLCENLPRISSEGWATTPLEHSVLMADRNDEAATSPKIIVAVRCYNEEKNIESFLKNYDFADLIVVSDGGSTDNSIELLKQNRKVKLLHYAEQESVNGETWNPDAGHINFVLNAAKAENPDWIIFDDMDCHPNSHLQFSARKLLEQSPLPQVNVFRLYLWGEDEYFPLMNNNLDERYTSLWAWKPNEVNIRADETIRHGTITGIVTAHNLQPPNCLLHKSWNPETIQKKMDRYNKLGLPMNHPFSFAGEPVQLPEWAKE